MTIQYFSYVNTDTQNAQYQCFFEPLTTYVSTIFVFLCLQQSHLHRTHCFSGDLGNLSLGIPYFVISQKLLGESIVVNFFKSGGHIPNTTLMQVDLDPCFTKEAFHTALQFPP